METSNESFKTLVPILKGSSNYHRWASAVQQALLAKDLWEAVRTDPVLKSDLSEYELTAIRTAIARNQKLTPERDQSTSQTPVPSTEPSEERNTNAGGTPSARSQITSGIVNLSDIFKVNKEVDTAYDLDEDNYLYHPRNNAAIGFITSTIAYTLQNTFKGIKAASKLWLEVKKLYRGTRDVRAAYHLKVISHIKYSDLDSVEKLVQ